MQRRCAEPRRQHRLRCFSPWRGSSTGRECGSGADQTARTAGASSLREPPGRVAQEQADGGFPVLAIRRGRLGVARSGDLGEFVLTYHDRQNDFAARASLAQNAGTLGCRLRHWWSPVTIEIRYGG